MPKGETRIGFKVKLRAEREMYASASADRPIIMSLIVSLDVSVTRIGAKYQKEYRCILLNTSINA